MPKTKLQEKTRYKAVQIPKDLVDLVIFLIPGFYRSHHEAIIEWIRLGIFGLVKTKYRLKKINKLKDLNKQQT